VTSSFSSCSLELMTFRSARGDTLPESAIILLWGVCGGGGGSDKHRSPSAGHEVRSSPRLHSCDLVLFISSVSLSSPSTFLCVAGAVQ
jgi:hypothetical protein